MKKEKNLKFKKALKIIIIVIFLLILSLITFHFINNFISKKQIESFQKTIEEISSNEISYVIIEINPKVLIELTGDKVTNKICLNSDCESIFKSLDLKNKKLKETITILYDTAKTKGIDVSNGVKLSTTNIKLQEFIEDLDYVTYNIITADEENNILENLENKEALKEKKNEYNKKLINIYKEDSDYGKYYTCKEENNTIKCYITSDFEKDLSEIFNITNLNTIINNARNLNRVLDKFNVQYNYQDSFGVKDIYEIKANETYLRYSNDLDYVASDANGNSNNIHYNFPYLEIENHFLGIENQLLPLIKLNLVNSTYDSNDLIMLGHEYNNNNNDNNDNNAIKYTISFDTNGGSKIDSQEVLKDEKIIKPSNPTRNGYKFIEWQLNGKKFDFSKKINSDIELTAKWEKIENSTNNSNKKEESTNNNTKPVEKTYLNFGDLYSMEKVKEIENKYNIKINLIADAKCGYIEGGDLPLIESGKSYNVHINSLEPYIQGACGDSGNNEEVTQTYECLDEPHYCANNLNSRPELLTCAKQLKELDTEYLKYLESHNRIDPLMSDINLSKYNALYIADNQTCDVDNCYYVSIECTALKNVYEQHNLMTYLSFRNY